jgi:hypothetical protein
LIQEQAQDNVNANDKDNSTVVIPEVMETSYESNSDDDEDRNTIKYRMRSRREI